MPKFHFVILLIIILAACQPSPISATSTTIASTSSPFVLLSTPTNFHHSTPTVVSIITPISPRQPQLNLPHGLEIEEYDWSALGLSTYENAVQWHEIHKRFNGEMKESYFSFPNQPPLFYEMENRGQIRNENIQFANVVLENSVIVTIQRFDKNTSLVKVSKSGITIYETKTPDFTGLNGLLEVWSYGEHWALVIIPFTSNTNNYTVDIILDGKSLSKTFGYKEAFGFQILNGRPLYFFKNEKGIGLSYDKIDTQLDYDEIPSYYREVGADYNPVPYKNRVEFFATRKQVNYLVIIGFLQK